MEDDGKVSDADWENRVLCSDESCIGVIGRDGRCNECGKPNGGRLFWNQASPAPSEESAPDRGMIHEPQDGDPDPGLPDPADAQAGGDEEWERRVLCRDERCIGVIGPDGRCKECGRSYVE